MIKVAQLICSSGLYGAERWVLALLRHLAGVDNLLICPSSSDDGLLREAEKLSIPSRKLEVPGNFALLDFVNKLTRLLRDEQIDVLHTHGYKADIVGYLAARKAGARILSTPHGWSFDADTKLRIYEALDRFILRGFDLVVPLSQDLMNSVSRVRAEKLRLINNFVDLETLAEPQQGDPRLITFIGRLIELKRVDDLIEAISHLREPNIKLQIIGDGPLKDQLTAKAESMELSERVRFLGYREDRLELLNQSAISVLPSVNEGTPRALMEAMAMKRLVIGADVPGIRDLITDQETGILVPVRNPQKLAEAIEFAIDHRQQAMSMADNARRLIEEKFSAKSAADRYGDLYRELIET